MAAILPAQPVTQHLPLDTGHIRNEGEPPNQTRGITMGSTVSTGKLAAAFKATSGKIMYVLFEETYEANCYPRTPSCWVRVNT